MMGVQGGGVDAYLNRWYVMVGSNVMIIRMRSDVSVQVISSNVVVTNLMMGVQGAGVDAYMNRLYAMGGMTVVIGRMKSNA